MTQLANHIYLREGWCHSNLTEFPQISISIEAITVDI